ncbi:MAG: 16S rRNA (cytosine(967)-C(5))-methyltransferase RsmB [Clostridia bacterium]|nr:16S rRNA (cytosine(967)-C(5))-methyltransferase RsmB [Clostridia bacterium]
MSNPRVVAAKALLRVEKDEAFSNIVLNDAIKSAGLEKADAAFASTLFYGVLERKITLDYYIRSLSSQPLSKVSPLTLQVLRCGLYQIVYMDKVPDSAAVNEAVKIIKKSKESRSFGYVNAVLRNFLRSRPQLPTNDTVRGISVNYSCGENLIEHLISDYSKEETVSFLEESLKNSEVFIRVNTLKTNTDELKKLLAEQGITAFDTDMPNALRLESVGSIERNSLYLEGYFHVQDISSQICAASVDARDNQKFIDMCAAPGGKTFTVCQYMCDKGEITACELYEHRTELIKKGAKRLGLTSVNTVCADATVFDADKENKFDRVLCDVPCSGSGVISRKPDIKYKNFSDTEELSNIQLKILKNGFKYLKSGGRLVYSTCSILKVENETVINKFLDEEEGAQLVSMRTYLPQTDKTDGFFIAVIEK